MKFDKKLYKLHYDNALPHLLTNSAGGLIVDDIPAPRIIYKKYYSAISHMFNISTHNSITNKIEIHYLSALNPLGVLYKLILGGKKASLRHELQHWHNEKALRQVEKFEAPYDPAPLNLIEQAAFLAIDELSAAIIQGIKDAKKITPRRLKFKISKAWIDTLFIGGGTYKSQFKKNTYASVKLNYRTAHKNNVFSKYADNIQKSEFNYELFARYVRHAFTYQDVSLFDLLNQEEQADLIASSLAYAEKKLGSFIERIKTQAQSLNELDEYKRDSEIIGIVNNKKYKSPL
ncbi:MAG: hypothetical protein FWE50_03620 [Alphaproteobacteria bacterium]|nr:hypothetical protein [Alphaproteobacteria bacterium]